MPITMSPCCPEGLGLPERQNLNPCSPKGLRLPAMVPEGRGLPALVLESP